MQGREKKRVLINTKKLKRWEGRPGKQFKRKEKGKSKVTGRMKSIC